MGEEALPGAQSSVLSAQLFWKAKSVLLRKKWNLAMSKTKPKKLSRTKTTEREEKGFA